VQYDCASIRAADGVLRQAAMVRAAGVREPGEHLTMQIRPMRRWQAVQDRLAGQFVPERDRRPPIKQHPATDAFVQSLG
jgi:hypothetical protein